MVRRGGTVAYIVRVSAYLIHFEGVDKLMLFQGYGEVVLPEYPQTAATMADFQRGEEWLGPWWEQPGRSVAVGLLEAIPFPPRSSGWSEGIRAKFDGQEGRDLVIRKRVTWDQFQGEHNIITFSVAGTRAHLPNIVIW